MRDNTVVFGLFVVVLVLAILILVPFASIWSLNTLFGLGIDYTFWTWLAMVWLSTVTFGGVAYNVRKKDGK
jgi:hypothetical protein